MPTQPEGIARKMLADYERANRDLPDRTLHQLAMFALAPRVGKEALEAIFERPLGQTPWRHRGWFWYTALRTSGLEPYWERFVAKRNSGERLSDCLRWLRARASKKEWETLGRRLGHPDGPLNPAGWNYKPDGKPRNIWTKGGTWSRAEPMTHILVLGEHIERDYSENDLATALGRAGAAKLERELYNLIDPDKELVPEAKKRAVDYARRRIPEIAGWDIERASLNTVAWFFQQPVRAKPGRFIKPDQTARYSRKMTDGNFRLWWDWLPPKDQP